MYEIEIEKEFSAAHFLKGYEGNCSALHGHNWQVKVMLRTAEVDQIGIAYDFRKLKQELDESLSLFDHKNLNELDLFQHDNPTSERIAKIIFDDMSERINDGKIRVSRVCVFESPGARASYFQEPG